MRRVFFLVLASVCSAWSQVRPAVRPPMPMVEIDVDPYSPVNAISTTDVPRSRVSGSAFVSVSDLSVPQRARKELEKANRSLAEHNWTQARDRLNKAISFYPSFAGAYNNLAFAYAHLGDVDRERQALEKAIALDDHLSLAHFNVGLVDMQEGKLPEAEMALNKAATLAPQDPRVLILLTFCQFLQKHFDDAIATSHRAHELSVGHAVAHRVAARAFEQKRQFDRAASELHLFLQEQPVGPAAEEARKELELVQGIQHE